VAPVVGPATTDAFEWAGSWRATGHGVAAAVPAGPLGAIPVGATWGMVETVAGAGLGLFGGDAAGLDVADPHPAARMAKATAPSVRRRRREV